MLLTDRKRSGDQERVQDRLQRLVDNRSAVLRDARQRPHSSRPHFHMSLRKPHSRLGVIIVDASEENSRGNETQWAQKHGSAKGVHGVPVVHDTTNVA